MVRQHEKPRRDVDSAERAFRIKALSWSLITLVPAYLLATVAARRTDIPAAIVIPAVTIGIVGGIAWLVLFVSERAARIGGGVFFGSGSTTPPVRQYSHVDALLAAGRVDDAIAELEQASATWPEDPQPCIRLARVLRDVRGRHEDAIVQFRHAIARSSDPGLELAALREIVEICTHRLRRPERALPHLARIAQRFPDSAAGTWARRELQQIKKDMGTEGI